MTSRGRLILASLFMLLLSATVLWAEDDPPGRVARLQYMSGSVSIQPQGTQDWVEGALNRPLTTSDNIWTDKASRAELNVGTGVLRMDSETSVTITNINDGTVQVELHQGTLSLHLRKLYNGEIYEIDTPNTAFTVQKSGDYRFDVQPENDSTKITVWRGEGDATGEGSSVRVRAHEQARFTGGTSLDHTFAAAPDLDGFDDWGHVRDQRQDKSLSAQYVSRDVIGYEDLDDNGYWRSVPEYGSVWVPRHVVAGWAPYRYGHWVWVSPWGWTWVDDAPWGFAPFHYGRWVYYDNYWGWAPGPVYVRPVYAPALVAWFGGRGWGVSLGFGGGPGYGWCPLGYGEPFVPWYRGSRNYFRNVNVTNTHITNITNVTNVYYNRGVVPDRYIHLNRGATAVSERTIVNGQQVSRAIVNVPSREFSKAPWNSGSPTPTRASRLGENAGKPAALPPQRSFARPVFSKLPAPARNGGDNTPFNRNSPEPVGVAGRPEGGNAGGPERGAQQPGFGGNNNARNIPRPENAPRSGAISRTASPDGLNNQINARPSTERNVPRPPERGGNLNADRPGQPQRPDNPPNAPRSGAITRTMPESGDRGMPSRNNNETNNVPRPPMGNNGSNDRGNAPQRMQPPADSPRSGSTMRSNPEPAGGNNNVQRERNAPQPPERNNNGNGRGADRSDRPQNNNFMRSGNGRAAFVPRPTGRVMPAGNQSAEYRAPQSSRSFSSPAQDSYRGNSRSYDSAPRSYSSRSYSSPSYSPGYSAPAMSRSTPRQDSAPQFLLLATLQRAFSGTKQPAVQRAAGLP